MKVLLLTQVLPYPPDSGPKVKTWNVIKYLARQHQITLVSFVRGDKTAEILELKKYCQEVYPVPIERKISFDLLALLRSLVSGQSWLMLRDDRGEMRDLVDKLCAQQAFDVVHADQHNMAQYALRVSNAARLLDTHNALWKLYQRTANTMRYGLFKLLYAREWRLLRRSEKKLLAKFDAVTAVSEMDRSLLLDLGHTKPDIDVIPIAVDIDEQLPVRRKTGAVNIVHVGTMFWQPNIDGVLWFLREVFPLIRQERPDVVFDVIGSRPPEAIQDFADLEKGVNVTGYVPEVEPYLENAALMIVPLLAGGGMRVKILNALSQEIPVVSTTVGCESIDVRDGRNILIADSPEDFASAVLRLLDDAQFAEDLGKNGRLLIGQKYDYRSACLPLDNIYQRITD